jgi:outer membrane receptor protein involved in Fe transport
MLDAPPPNPSFEFQLASQGMSKGLRQTDGAQWLARGELDVGPVLIGASAKNVTSGDRDGELLAYLGIRRGLAGFDIAASAGAKFALGAHGPRTDAALEASIGISRPFGRLTPRLSATWSPNDLGGTGETLFVEAGASWRLSDHLGLGAAAGRRARAGGPDETAWNAGLSWRPVRRVTLDLRYYDTDRRIDSTYRARLVGSLRLAF